MLRRSLPRAAGEAMRLAVALFSVWLTVSTFVAVGWLRPVVVAGDSMAPHARRGDRVWVDRLRSPRRWDAAVVRSPDDARRLIVKRVIGLPGERVEFARGDVVIDGRVIAKSHSDRRRLRVPVDGAWREPSGWLAGRGWTATPGGWRFDAAENATLRLREPATDSLARNVDVTRRLNVAADLELSFDVRLDRDATLKAACSGPGVRLTQPGQTRVRLSTFDGECAATVDGVKRAVTSDGEASAGVVRFVAFGSGELRNLRLWRDVHYEASALRPGPITLGADQWLLVGDNQAVSIDGRNWRHAPGVPRRLLVGVAAAL